MKPTDSAQAGAPRTRMRLILALSGSLLIVLGVFAPLVRIPFGGTPNTFDLYKAQGDVGFLWAGVFFLVLAAGSGLLAMAGRYAWLWFTGLVGLVCWVAGYMKFHSALADEIARMQLQLADKPFRGLAISMLSNIQLAWGAFMLLLGVVLVLVSALAREDWIRRR
jgi:hypothetical protein